MIIFSIPSLFSILHYFYSLHLLFPKGTFLQIIVFLIELNKSLTHITLHHKWTKNIVWNVVIWQIVAIKTVKIRMKLLEQLFAKFPSWILLQNNKYNQIGLLVIIVDQFFPEALNAQKAPFLLTSNLIRFASLMKLDDDNFSDNELPDFL